MAIGSAAEDVFDQLPLLSIIQYLGPKIAADQRQGQTGIRSEIPIRLLECKNSSEQY
jgi:hypothetical protein